MKGFLKTKTIVKLTRSSHLKINWQDSSKNLAQEHVNIVQVELIKIFLQLLGTDGNRRERHTSSFPSPFIIIMYMKWQSKIQYKFLVHNTFRNLKFK